MKSVETASYFHGKITRDRAEDILMSQGAIEGMFLLRESVNGNYVVSICHCNKISHYNVEHQPDGTYQILTGRKFPGPLELIEHHMKHLDGFLTLARIPLERFPNGTSYYILQGVKASVFEELIRKKVIELGLKNSNSVDEALSGQLRNHLKRLVLRELHESQHWFHHFIRRTEADARLKNAGHTEGQFLVRQKKDEYGFVLSISYQEQPKHYKINCLFEKLNIDGGQYFDSLIEMIDHYHFRQDGLLCKLRFGIECPGFVRTQTEFSSCGEAHFEGAHSSMCNIVGLMSSSNQYRPSSRLTQLNSPINSSISSISSPNQIQDSRLSLNNNTDWIIRSRDTSIDSEIAFSRKAVPQTTTAVPTLTTTTTTTPVTASSSTNETQANQNNGDESGDVATADLINFSEWSTNLPRLLNDTAAVSYSLNDLEKTDGISRPDVPTELHIPNKPPRSGVQATDSNNVTEESFLGSSISIFTDNATGTCGGLNEPQIVDEEWIEPEFAFSPISHNPAQHDFLGNSQHKLRAASMPSSKLQPGDLNLLDPLFSKDTQKVYDALPPPTGEIGLSLARDRLEIRQKLGGGNFGCVFGGFYSISSNTKIPVAIKKLKDEVHSQIAENEILLEASTMSQLKHQHIVRLIGVCKTDQLLLILELAPFGPINKYLRRHPSTTLSQLLEIAGQIARGMAYLEASKFVHRDLAARNVLLVNEGHAKISDFGMSKALNVGHEYYRAASAGRWPLKWYAPECIYYFRFNSKSDVWSYAVTLWEIFSYGDRPYRGMKGTDILAMLDRGQRLPCPAHCPAPVYEVMQQCWTLEPVGRPTFAELVLVMTRLLMARHALVAASRQTCDTPATTFTELGSTSGGGGGGHYQANSSGSSVARTCYESGESSQFSSPPISSKPSFSDKWPIKIFQK